MSVNQSPMSVNQLTLNYWYKKRSSKESSLVLSVFLFDSRHLACWKGYLAGRVVKICSAIKDCLRVVASNGILQAAMVQSMPLSFLMIFLHSQDNFGFMGTMRVMLTCKHSIPAWEDAQASMVQLPAFSPASSNGQCHCLSFLYVKKYCSKIWQSQVTIW